jgi:hypothetical protein
MEGTKGRLCRLGGYLRSADHLASDRASISGPLLRPPKTPNTKQSTRKMLARNASERTIRQAEHHMADFEEIRLVPH